MTNNGSALANGAYPTWHRNQEIISGSTIVTPTDGSYQADCGGIDSHQDEWLISASFNCPSDAVLSFDSRVFLGSSAGDSYSVKLSTDDGQSWSNLWDASQQSGGWNHYEVPIVIDLAAYTGRQLRIAFHANDNELNEGLYYDWFIDNVRVQSSIRNVQRGIGRL
ncbi:MAG: choice-of-anchor J domain-containing protein [Candidatus Cloacimonetes bacterium]|nr:choice-of-anchor J domain-containing protein [Candidatus Cloacimonadota bacterium]